MHVCHLSDGSVEGDYFRNIAKGLKGAGIDVSMIELPPGREPRWFDEVRGVGFLSLEARSKKDYPGAIRRLAEYLNAQKVDILQTHLFYGGLVGSLACRKAEDTQLVLMRHHTSLVRMLGSRFHVWADRRMAERADHVITVSEAARQYMLEVDGIRRNDIEVVHLGLDLDKWRPDEDLRQQARKEFGFGPEDFVVGYVGNQLPAKGHLELIGAFEHMAERLPSAKLLLVGRGELSEVREAIDRIGSGRVVEAGWRNDTVACYNAMDLFVQPSLSEAFSQVILEAMAVGVPVIATDVGGATEVIRDDENGFIVQPGDVAGLAECAVKVLSDRELRRRLGSAAGETIRKSFTAERMVKRHIQLYQEWS